MSLFGAGYDPGLISKLLSVLPAAKYGYNRFQHILPTATGPLVSPNRSYGSGASPIVGQFRNPQSDAVGNALSNVLGISGQLGQLMQQQNDPMTQLYNQLLDQLQQPVAAPTGINKDDLMNQVKAALNPIYDQRAATARAQDARGEADIKGMAQALANDFKATGAAQAKENAQNQADVAAIYGQLRSNIEGSYGRVNQDQADLFQQLGIQDALPAVTEQQQPSQMDALNAASANQAQQQQYYQDTSKADQTYYNEGSPIAIMAGNEQAANLLSQLTDYLNQNESERASGIQSGYMDQLGQAQNQLLQQQQMASQETNRRQDMLWQILQSQLQGNKSQASPLDQFMGSLPSNVQQSVAGAFTQLQRSPEAIYGKVEDPRSPVPGTFVSTTPQWYAEQADKMFQNGQIDAATHQALLMYLQLYYGNGSGG
jgi:hypothetical protein